MRTNSSTSAARLRLLLLGAAASCILSPPFSLFSSVGGKTASFGGGGFFALAAEEDDNVFGGDGGDGDGDIGSNELLALESEPTDDGRVRMVITFEDILPDEIESLLEIAGIEVQLVLIIPEMLAEVVMMTYEWARAVAKLPFVKFVEEDPKLYIVPNADARPVPGLSGPSTAAGGEDAGGTRNRGLRHLQQQDGEDDRDYDDMYGLDLIRAYSVSDDDIDNRIICVIDSGCERTHYDLSANSLDGDAFPGLGNWYDDDNGHGTHVAGTIAAVNNGYGLQGVIRNGKAQLYCVKIFDETGESYASDAVVELQKCANAGANVVSMSYGRTDSGFGTGYAYFEDQAYRKAYEDDGMLLVAAAGNDGNTKKTYPASYDSVISVGSVGRTKLHSEFSQYNADVELAAPGEEIASTYVDNTYAALSGTSMATPRVSAAAALIWSHFTDRTNAEIREALIESAEDLGYNGRDSRYGYGLVRADLAYQYLLDGQGGSGGGGSDNGGGDSNNGDGGDDGSDNEEQPGGGEGGGSSTTMCVTDPSFWTDSDGTGCDWYASSSFLCNTFGFFYENYGKTARGACCSCGGGKMVTADDTVTPDPDDGNGNNDNNGDQDQDDQGGGDGSDDPPPPPPGTCQDVPDWYDTYGDGCDWYGTPYRCAEFGTIAGTGGLTAADACCLCRGRMMSAFASANDKTDIAGVPPPSAAGEGVVEDDVPPAGSDGSTTTGTTTTATTSTGGTTTTTTTTAADKAGTAADATDDTGEQASSSGAAARPGATGLSFAAGALVVVALRVSTAI